MPDINDSTIAGFFNRLTFFAISEFRHPEMMDRDFLLWIDAVRQKVIYPWHITSDGRLPAEQHSLLDSGAAASSLHPMGCAIDFMPNFHGADYRECLWKIVNAFMTTPTPNGRGIELEIVWSNKDHHIHAGLFPDQRPHRLIVTVD